MTTVINILDEMIHDAEKAMYPEKGQLDMKEFNIFSCGKASLEIAKSRIQALGDGWIPVSERLPANENYVLGTYVNSYGKSRVIRCLYTRKFQTEITENLDDDYGDYSKEKDAVFFPEGWYESNETDETYYNPDGDITHWMPLPLPPK